MGDPAVKNKLDIFHLHPCFNSKTGHWFSALHLPVAPECNMRCNYCTRGYNCPNENPPGVLSKLMTPGEAVRRVGQSLASERGLTVAAVAGPGEPLVNEQTFITLNLVNREFPGLVKCVSTNGLSLAEKVGELVAAGVNTVSVTVNAVEPYLGAYIYHWININGELAQGPEGASLLIERQLEGIKTAVREGIKVKVNTILIPGINDGHLEEVALAVKKAGASLMQVSPLVPMGRMAGYLAPSPEETTFARKVCSRIISQANLSCNCLVGREHC